MASGRGGRGSVLLVVAILFVIQLVTWRGSSRTRDLYGRTQDGVLQKREILIDLSNESEVFGRKLHDEKKKKKKKHDNDADKGKHSTHHTSSTSTHSVTSTLSSHPTHTPACRPLPSAASPERVCDHVRKYCPPSGHLNYLEFFYCIGLDVPYTSTLTPMTTAAPHSPSAQEDGSEHGAHNLTTRVELLRVFALLTIIMWMLFLFSWVGIVASDFFCPNLSTLAARLGLSESTAGVTFLAFGNGSPDVFSTFGAMRTGSGSLAIGELIGAASFIVSVISGSMMLIAPFRVKRYPFLRDVGFFTVAVALTFSFLLDGNLRLAECISLIALYLLYATTVIIGSWWHERRRAQRRRMASIRSEHSISEGGGGVVSEEGGGVYSDVDGGTGRTHGSPYMPPMSAIEYEPDVDPFTQWAEATSTATNGGRLTPRSAISPGPSPLLAAVDIPTSSTGNQSARLQRFRSGVLARHSLLGAVEFRDVVENLRKGSSVDRTMDVFRSRDPERYLPHPTHHHQHHHHHLPQSPAAQQAQLINSPGRRHSRTKSMTRPQNRRFLSQADTKVVNSLVRSRSTVGSSAHEGALADVERPTLEQIGQSSKLAAAVDDPWKEHDANDGCDAGPLPPPALPLTFADDDEASLAVDNEGEDQSMRKTKPALPRLVVRQATAPPREEDDVFTKRNNGSRSAHLTMSPAEMLLRSAHSKQSFRRTFRSTVRALFPSLRHLREKSWLGLFVGAVTAPAIFVLNLTLPVVDDEAEKAMIAGEKQGLGRIRLEGEEDTIRAHPRSALLAEDDSSGEEEEDATQGRGTIVLDGTSPGDNPWDSQTKQSKNAKGILGVGSALRHLQEDASPLIPAVRSQTPAVHLDDAQSTCSSDDSCHSDSSHVETRVSRVLLGVAQCAFAPPFCTWAITSSAQSKHVLVKTTFAFVGGLIFAVFALLAAVRIGRREDGCPPGLLKSVGWARVAVGFFVSVLYIMSIVDEVVSILQTLGLVLGLSDAILGLTVFAMGNSLGDLVANITIARMGHPVMAISACFAGPLLNLLLGIGISGTWLLSGHHESNDDAASIIQTMRHKPHIKDGIYHIDFSPTLTVSGCGLLVILLGTLIAVPMNNFYLDRKIGLTLICTYALIMCVNIGVEVYNLQG